MTLDGALLWSTRLLGLSLSIQSVELLLLGRLPSRLAPAQPKFLAAFDPFFALLLLGAGLFLGATGDPRGCCVGAPAAWLLAVRFGGTFNGGSDFLTLVVALPLGVFAAHPTPAVGRLAVLGIGLQWLLSYTIAGFAKLADTDWRRGRALALLAERGRYALPDGARRLLGEPRVSRFLGTGTLLFECAAPLALLDPRCMLVFVGVALTFHGAVALTLGLNRFLWAWLAAVPCGLALPELLR